MNINNMLVVDIIPPTHQNRPGYMMEATSITIHETANPSKGADAKAHSNYLLKKTTKASWHYTVDDECVIQHLPITENAWHAGDGRFGKGNRTSIAIEICVNGDGDFEKAKENAKLLIQMLIKETGINAIVPHKHWLGKNCPRNILNDSWVDFVNYVTTDLYTDRAFEIVFNERNKARDNLKNLKNDIEKVINNYI